ncbi:MAG: cupin domain-containing protein [Treponema sp.]|jgi:predicted cupin superfamily sugar epimerase|nr:cupin domain-containing protein [Treponema sp.]
MAEVFDTACQDAEYWIRTLKLQSHAEGGWYREMWRCGQEIPAAALPAEYGGGRRAASLIYYLLRGEEISAWHKLRSAEIWTWHAGGVLEQRLGGGGGRPEAAESRLIGTESGAGESFLAVVPANTWQTTRIAGGDYVLVSCIVAPAFTPEDFFMLPAAGKTAEENQ